MTSSTPDITSRWSPVTNDFGLIEADPNKVADEMQKWWKEIGYRLRVKRKQAGLEELLCQLEPLNHVLNKTLLVASKYKWTAVYRNGFNGSDPSSIMSVLSKRMQVRAMRVCSTPSNAVFPATAWVVYDPRNNKDPYGVCRRAIAAINDGGRWVFEQFGQPFEFENTAAFTARRKKDRFTHEILMQNLSHFGVHDLGDALFQRTSSLSGIVLSRDLPKNIKTFSLAEVQDGKPWKR